MKNWEKAKHKLLAAEIDRNLNFDKYVSSLCKNVGKNGLY